MEGGGGGGTTVRGGSKLAKIGAGGDEEGGKGQTDRGGRMGGGAKGLHYGAGWKDEDELRY